MPTPIDATHLFQVTHHSTLTHFVFKIHGPIPCGCRWPHLLKDNSKPHSYFVEVESMTIARITVPMFVRAEFEGWVISMEDGWVEVWFKKLK